MVTVKPFDDINCFLCILLLFCMKTSVSYWWKLEQPQKPEVILFTKQANLTSDTNYFLESKYHSWDLVLKTVMKRHAGTYLCQDFDGTQFVTLQKYTLVVNGRHSV